MAREKKRAGTTASSLGKSSSKPLRWSTLIAAVLSVTVLLYMYLLYEYYGNGKQPAPRAAPDSPAASHVHEREGKSHLQQTQQETQQDRQEELARVKQSQRTLRFQVCNGFGNQRLAVMYAAIIAKNTGRALVLPHLIREGTQRSFAENSGHGEDSLVHFGMVYDVDAFKR